MKGTFKMSYLPQHGHVAWRMCLESRRIVQVSVEGCPPPSMGPKNEPHIHRKPPFGVDCHRKQEDNGLIIQPEMLKKEV